MKARQPQVFSWRQGSGPTASRRLLALPALRRGCRCRQWVDWSLSGVRLWQRQRAAAAPHGRRRRPRPRALPQDLIPIWDTRFVLIPVAYPPSFGTLRDRSLHCSLAMQRGWRPGAAPYLRSSSGTQEGAQCFSARHSDDAGAIGSMGSTSFDGIHITSTQQSASSLHLVAAGATWRPSERAAGPSEAPTWHRLLPSACAGLQSTRCCCARRVLCKPARLRAGGWG